MAKTTTQVGVIPVGRFSHRGRRYSAMYKVRRNAHPGGRCECCGELAIRLYSYGDAPGLFCNKSCYLGGQVLGVQSLSRMLDWERTYNEQQTGKLYERLEQVSRIVAAGS